MLQSKKLLALLIITLMLLSLMPQVALAATTHTVADGETLNIETSVLTHADNTTETLTISDGDTISVAAGATATITGSKNVKITCGEGAALTLDGVTIDVSATSGACALSFTGIGNTLTLSGASSLKSGEDEPGVRVEGTTVLEIAGDGSLDVTGGGFAAGIGGGINSGGGTINISGGVIEATGGSANIMMGSYVYYGIAGIGGGWCGGGGTIDISGGIVYAIKGLHGQYDINGNDIGKSEGGSNGTINISGDAAVLLGTNMISSSPATSTHTHYEFTQDTECAYGIAVPAEWAPTFGAYLILCDLNYDKNDGTGTPPSSVTNRAAGASVTVKGGSGLSCAGHVFDGWNTAEDGSGTPYDPGDEITMKSNMTLYAQWALNLTIDTPNLLAGTLGESYSSTVTASGGGSYTWYASGLPDGLSMERGTGNISGKPNETGAFSARVTVYDGEGRKAEKTYTLTVNTPSETGKYGIVPENDSAYTVSTADGFTTLTIKSGVTGFRYFKVSINSIVAHEGEETCVFVHMRGGVQIGFNASVADFDIMGSDTAGFNVQPGDIIKVYVVDELSNSAGKNPVLLQ